MTLLNGDALGGSTVCRIVDKLTRKVQSPRRGHSSKPECPRILSDVRYGQYAGAEQITDETTRRKRRIWRTFVIAVRSFRYDAIVTSEGSRTGRGLLFLCFFLCLTRQRKLIITEFIAGGRSNWRGRLAMNLYRLVLNRSCLAFQVMTAWERELYAEQLRIDLDRISIIPFFYFDDRLRPEPVTRKLGNSKVFSSGKNSCDWPTLIEAARGQEWELEIACSSAEADEYNLLAAECGVRMIGPLPRQEHDRRVAEADLYVLSLAEKGRSAGHVRLMTAATFGTPVISTHTSGVSGYEGLAKALVPVRDAIAMREAISVELAASNRESSQTVADLASTRSQNAYLQEVAQFILRAAEGTEATESCDAAML